MIRDLMQLIEYSAKEHSPIRFLVEVGQRGEVRIDVTARVQDRRFGATRMGMADVLLQDYAPEQRLSMDCARTIRELLQGIESARNLPADKSGR